MTDEQRKRIHDITYSTDDRAELAERIVRLEDENARLRELAKALHECTAKTIPDKRCTECDLFDGEDGCLDLVRMRELGIEADDDD